MKRRSQRQLERPEEVALLHIKKKVDLDKFRMKNVPSKGRGVFAKTNLEKDEFLLQYNGKLRSWEDGDDLEEKSSSGYRFFFRFKGQGYCIDATEEPTSGPMLGRLVNHGTKKEVNVKLSVIDVDGEPALCLFACRSIEAGEELLYDYGVKGLPWEEKSKRKKHIRGNSQSYKPQHSASHLETLQENAVIKKQVENIAFSTGCKTADENNGTHISVHMTSPDFPNEDNFHPATPQDSGETISSAQSIEMKSVRPAFSFVTSGVGNVVKHQAEKLADLHGCRYTEKFSSCTTHVIMKADENMMCPMTLKYLQGIAAKKWVVSFKWVESSLERGKLLPERDFEVRGDETVGIHFGPTCSRTAASLLLHGYSIKVQGQNSAITEDEVAALATCCGALVTEDVTCTSKRQNVIINVDEKNQHCSSATVKGTLPSVIEEVPTVRLAWLFNSIATQTIQPLENFMCYRQLLDDDCSQAEGVEKVQGQTKPIASQQAKSDLKVPLSLKSGTAVADREACLMLLNMTDAGSSCEMLDGEDEDLYNEMSADNIHEEECNREDAIKSGNEGDAHDVGSEISGEKDVDSLVCREMLNDYSGNIHGKECNVEDGDRSMSECNTSSTSESDDDDDPSYCPSADSDSALSDQHSIEENTVPRSSSKQLPIEEPAAATNYNTTTKGAGQVSTLLPNKPSRKSQRFSSKQASTSDGKTDAEESTVTHAEKRRMPTEKPYKKPYRLCIFCNSMKSKLAQHITKQHSSIDRVAAALKLPKKKRLEALDVFKKEGILKVNKEQAKLDEPSYQREKMGTCNNPLVMCNICSGFYSKRYIKRHTNICQKESESSPSVVPVPVSLLQYDDQYNDNFMKDVLNKFRMDEVGTMCTKDAMLLKIGKRLWEKQRQKVDKKTEVRKSVMRDMRRLATLYIEVLKTEESMGELPSKQGDVADLFQRENFRHLEEGITTYSSSDTAAGTSIKAGLKLGLYYLLKSAAKILKATYYIEDKDNLAENIDKFVAVLELNQSFLFGDATYKIDQQRQVRLRRPEALPQESDIKLLRDHTVRRMKEIVSDELGVWDVHRFVQLRDLLVCRLTLFNARRGGEPSRLLLSEWKDAENDAWLDKQQVAGLDPLDKALLKSLKIGYQSGKGKKHLVPVLFPLDTLLPLKKIADEEVRSLVKVDPSNPFLFASVNESENHTSGWHAVNNICEQISLNDKGTLTATKNRHRVSTLFALMDVPEHERHFIYKHLGHSEETNKNIYQTPLALKELTVVGRRLQTIDEGDIPSCSEDAAVFPQSFTDSKEECSDGEETADEDSQREECDEPALEAGKVRKYTKWDAKDTAIIQRYFKTFYTGKGKKKLPGRKEVLAFLEIHPEIKHDWKTVHTKVMNEVRKAKQRASDREEEWH